MGSSDLLPLPSGLVGVCSEPGPPEVNKGRGGAVGRWQRREKGEVAGQPVWEQQEWEKQDRWEDGAQGGQTRNLRPRGARAVSKCKGSQRQQGRRSGGWGGEVKLVGSLVS